MLAMQELHAGRPQGGRRVRWRTQVRFVRGLLFKPSPKFESLAELNAWLGLAGCIPFFLVKRLWRGNPFN